MTLTTLPFALFLTAMLTMGSAVAQQRTVPDPIPAKATDLFASAVPLSFTLAAQMQAIVGDRKQPGHDSLSVKHAALLSYSVDAAGGPGGAIPMALVVRGNFRRDPKHCQFPPLYIDFPKKKVGGTPFANQNTLKLVTHCQDEEFIVREYLVYKLYNLITDLSFRARLARVTYLDSASVRPAETHWAFLIEDEDDVARRNGTGELKAQTPTSRVDSMSLATMAVFEYMIGNIDWDVEYRHNIRLMTVPGGNGKPNVVPYDFDHAVIVDATYASRADNTGQRIYRGPLYEGQLLKRVVARFNELKPQFYALYESEGRLSGAYVKKTVSYLDTFYKNINDPRTVKRHFFRGDTGGKLFASFH